MSVVLMERHRNVLLLTFVIFCGSFLVYWRFCMTELKSHRPSLKEIIEKHTLMKVRPMMETPYKSKKELVFDELLSYILHPKGHCRAPVTLGGVRFKDNRINGDKMICLDPGSRFQEDCVVFAFGVDMEMSFEESIHQAFQCRVYAFDPTMDDPDHLNSKGIWFFDKGVGDFDADVFDGSETWTINTFDSILRGLRLENLTSIDVVKIDIEGSEYFVLKDILKKGYTNKVNHLCVKIHLDKDSDWSMTLQLLRAIEEESEMVHFNTRNDTRSPMLNVPGLHHRSEQLSFEMAWTRIPRQRETSDDHTAVDLEKWLNSVLVSENEV